MDELFDLLAILADNYIAIESEMLSCKDRAQFPDLFLIHGELLSTYAELLRQYLDVEEAELC
jgi:hypothetical protein